MDNGARGEVAVTEAGSSPSADEPFLSDLHTHRENPGRTVKSAS